MPLQEETAPDVQARARATVEVQWQGQRPPPGTRACPAPCCCAHLQDFSFSCKTVPARSTLLCAPLVWVGCVYGGEDVRLRARVGGETEFKSAHNSEMVESEGKAKAERQRMSDQLDNSQQTAALQLDNTKRSAARCLAQQRLRTRKRLCLMAWHTRMLLAAAGRAADTKRTILSDTGQQDTAEFGLRESVDAGAEGRKDASFSPCPDSSPPAPPKSPFQRVQSSGLQDLVEMNVEGEQERERQRQLHVRQQALDRRTEVEKLIIEMQVRILNSPSTTSARRHRAQQATTGEESLGDDVLHGRGEGGVQDASDARKDMSEVSPRDVSPRVLPLRRLPKGPGVHGISSLQATFYPSSPADAVASSAGDASTDLPDSERKGERRSTDTSSASSCPDNLGMVQVSPEAVEPEDAGGGGGGGNSDRPGAGVDVRRQTMRHRHVIPSPSPLGTRAAVSCVCVSACMHVCVCV